MPTAYTSLLGLALPVTGELSGTWGDTVNNSITSLLDTSVAGTTNVSTDADVTLTTTTGASNTARQAILLFSGARTALRTVTAPAQSKIYTVINATTGGFSVKLVGAGPTTGVTIVAGESAVCAWNGSDFVKVSNTGGSASFVNLTASGTVTFTGLTASQAVFTNASDELVSNAITGTGNVVMSASPTLTGTIGAAAATLSGNLTLSGGTANGVTYLNGSKVVTSGSALTFDGTGLGIGTGTIPAGRKLVIDSGNIRLSNDYQIEWGGSTVGLYGNGSTNSLSFFANTSEQMRLTSTGLGIGTSSPAYKLDVNGQARLGGSTGLVFGVGTAFAVGQAEIYSTSTTPMGLGTTGAAVLRLYTNSTLQATLDSSGNLGIGTSSPASKLEVTSTTDGDTVRISFPSAATGSTGGGLQFRAYTNSANLVEQGRIQTICSDGSASYGAYMRFMTANAGSLSEKMRLDSSGALLVGTTSNSWASYGGISEFRKDQNTPTLLTISNQNTGSSGSAGILLAGYGNSWVQSIGTTAKNGNALTWALDASASPPSEKMRLDTSGNLGLGVTPSAWSTAGNIQLPSLTLAGQDYSIGSNYYQSGGSRYISTARSCRLSFYDGQFAFLQAPSGTAGTVMSATQAMTLDASGRLGIGETSPSNRLVVGSVSDASNFLRINSSTVQTVFGSDASGGYVGTDNSYALRFFTNNTERARITSDGTLCVNTTSYIANSGEKFSITSNGDTALFQTTNAGTGGASIHANRNGSTGNFLYFTYTGNFNAVGSISTNGTNTTYSTSSDYRLKNTIAPMTGALAKVALLKPCTYKWNFDNSEGEGFIAHELAEVCPQAVTGEKDAVDAEGNPKYQGIDTSFLVATLTAALQEQQAIINQLKARLDAANL